MHLEYTPEEVRTLLTEHETLEYGAATDADVAEATDVLEGIEELVRKLEPSVRREELLTVGLPVADHFYVEVVRNCRCAAGVAIDPEGATSFMVTGQEFGEHFPTYFSARQAVVGALLGVGTAGPEAASRDGQAIPQVGTDLAPARIADGAGLVSLLKENGWAVPAGRTLADIDPSVLTAVYTLSEEVVAHLFATEDGDGIVLAMAGSTEGDRRRAVERLGTLPGRAYSSRPFSVLSGCGEAGSHYSEESWFGHTLKEAPRPKEVELDDAAERFRAARLVRPSNDHPLDTASIRRRVRDQDLVRAAVGAAFRVDANDAFEFLQAVLSVVLIAGIYRREMVRRALAAQRPWDSKAERGRMQATGRRLRSEIAVARKARRGDPVSVTPAAALDGERQERLAPDAEDPQLRRSVERRLKSGRAAYDTARAVYLQRCPELTHKLLHLLRRDGAQPEREFVSRRRDLAAHADSPETAVRAALRTLARAGKVRRIRSQKTGEVFLAATEPLDGTGYRRSLNGLIRDRGHGIVNPWADTTAVEADGEADEWQRGAEDLEAGELERLAPRRLRDTTSYEQPLPAADLVAEPSAQEEIEAVANEVA